MYLSTPAVRRSFFLISFLTCFIAASGQFAPPQLIGIDSVDGNFTLFDVEGDGDIDIFTNGDTAVVAYINAQNSGQGWMRQTIDLSLMNSIFYRREILKHADLNGDGVDELVVFSGAGETAYIATFSFNPDNSSFAVQDTTYFFGFSECEGRYFYFEDFDQDGDKDIMFNLGWDGHFVENVDGTGQLSIRDIVDGENLSCGRIDLRDFNGDQVSDLLAGTRVFINDGNANFSFLKTLAYAPEVKGPGGFINDTLLAYHDYFTNSPSYVIAELTEDSVAFRKRGPFDLNRYSYLFFHDFTKDGTAEYIHYDGFNEPYILEYAELDEQTLLYERNTQQYTNQKIGSIDAVDFNQDGLDDIIILNGKQLFWMENVSDLPGVSGVAYIDLNKNGQRDPNEPPVPNVQITSPGADHTFYTNEQGEYFFYAPAGTQEISASIFHDNLEPVDSEPRIVELSLGSDISGVDFGFTFIDFVEDLNISTLSNITRCNSNVRFSLIFENDGTYLADGTINLTLAENTAFVSSPETPLSIGTDAVSWSFTDLAPFERRKIELVLLMPSADFLNDTLVFRTTITDEDGSFSETDIYRSLLRCSFDPNDKQVDPLGYGPGHLTLLEENELEYLVRFQNTGNDTAFQVRITDELHPLLDINTFQVISASHRYRAEIQERTLTFYFDDILLPDSTTNLAASQGYVLFQINADAGLKDGDQITNRANIYFDRNEAIVTNEVVNNYVSFICIEQRNEVRQTICAGESFEGYSSSGTYVDEFTTVNGCDSIRTLILTVDAVLNSTINREICSGGNVEGYTVSGTYTDTFIAANGCDSIRTLNLTVLENIVTTVTREICSGGNAEGYTASGTYTDTFIAANGCDSIRTLNLTVLENIATTVTREICSGGNAEGYTASGIYTDTFVAANGCDSIRTLNLTVLENIATTITREICSGGNAEGYTASGTYTDTFVASNGCDSIRTLNLTVLESINTAINREICSGGNFEGYNASGTYTDTFIAANGCDSIRTLNLTVLENIATTITREICSGGNAEGYTASGTYTDTFVAANGCDSIRTLNLTVLENISTTITMEICSGGNAEGYTASGTYTDTFVAANGCDSIRTLNLTVLENISTTITREICSGGDVDGYTASGTYTDTFIAANGCDSIRTLNLMVLDNISTTITREICNGESAEGYTTAGIYTNTFVADSGCDSIRTLILTILPSIETTIEEEICSGDDYEGYTTSGIYTDAFVSSVGCDSTRTLMLQVLPHFSSTLNITICDETLQGPPEVTTETEIFTAVNGCDSTVTINYRRLPLETISLDTSICVGDSLFGYSAAGLYIDTLYNDGPCGKVRKLQLNTLDGSDAQCLVAVADPSEYGIAIYPNPVKELLTIRFDHFFHEQLRINLVDLQGRTVLEKVGPVASKIQLGLATLPAGMYFLQLNFEGITIVQKVIKLE